MKIATISVQRPVFATVVSLLLVILGLLALTRLAVRELPEVESPDRLDRDHVPRRLGRRRRDQDHAGHRGPRRRPRGHHQDRRRRAWTAARASTSSSMPARSVDDAANDVRDRVSRVASNLPPEADPPEIGKVDANADPVMLGQPLEQHAGRARAHRLRRARDRRPLSTCCRASRACASAARAATRCASGSTARRSRRGSSRSRTSRTRCAARTCSCPRGGSSRRSASSRCAPRSGSTPSRISASS